MPRRRRWRGRSWRASRRRYGLDRRPAVCYPTLPLAMRRRAVRMPANQGEFPLHDRPRTNTAGGVRVDGALKKRQVGRACGLYAPVSDFIFDWIFAPGRTAAIKQCGIVPSDTVLEVGIGTGLNLPLYPATCRLTGIDLSGEMLDKAVERVQNLAMPNVTLKVMDATSMDFGDNEFDKALATYTISAVPRTGAVLSEVWRGAEAGGTLVDLKPLRTQRRGKGWLQDPLRPVLTRLGGKAKPPPQPV